MLRNDSQPRVAIVGGGLAGLAAAAALAGRGLQVELIEARQQLGGRAGSFFDATAQEWIDHCQHVGMGCCTNLADFCRVTGVDRFFQRHEVLHFFGPDGRRYDVRGSKWLPAPFHLAPSLLRLGYLSFAERWSAARAMLRLARTPLHDEPRGLTIGQWLRGQKQSQQAIDRFWSVVLVSALGESLDRASLAAARQVFVDGFMAHRRSYQILVPTIPLADLYDRIAQWLTDHGVEIHLGQAVSQINSDQSAVANLTFSDNSERPFDHVVAAVPWCRLRELVPHVPALHDTIKSLAKIESAPITGIHLWFDRPITPLAHAVLVDRLSQWLFRRSTSDTSGDSPRDGQATSFYYQVVISASRDLAGRDRDEVLREVVDDLKSCWPAARDAQLLHSRMITQHEAVFSIVPGLDDIRPHQKTVIANLTLAGDWTKTGWPSTMESAVRSGRLAAESVLEQLGVNQRLVVDDLPSGRLARWLLRPANEPKSTSRR